MPPKASAIADAPDWLLALLCPADRTEHVAVTLSGAGRAKAWAGAAVDAELSLLRLAPNGTRNAALNTAPHNLGQIAGGGHVIADDTLTRLRGVAKDIGLDVNEVEATLASGWGAGLAKPRHPPEGKRTGDDPIGTSAFYPFDMSVIASNRSLPAAFPLALLPPKWSDWCISEADCAGTPADYVALALLVTAASVIGNARRVAPWAGWIEPCILWGMIVGDPSAGKTPGLKPPLALVHPIDRERTEAFAATMQAWRERDAEAKLIREVWEREFKAAVSKSLPRPAMPTGAVSPPKPVCPALIINDSTPEMLALLARAMPKGLLLFRDELAGWLCDFGRYGGDGERQLWLEAYNGAPRRIDRVKHDASVDPALLGRGAGRHSTRAVHLSDRTGHR